MHCSYEFRLWVGINLLIDVISRYIGHSRLSHDWRPGVKLGRTPTLRCSSMYLAQESKLQQVTGDQVPLKGTKEAVNFKSV